MAEAIEGVVRARRVEIVNARGRVRAVLGVEDTPAPTGELVSLALLDLKGAAVATLGVAEDGGWLIFEHAGNIVLEVGSQTGDVHSTPVRSTLHLADDDGVAVAGFSVTPEGRLETYHDTASG